MGNDALKCGGVCCFVLFVVAAGLVGGSFKIVEPVEYGLLQNTISKEIDSSKVYQSGRYWVGLARTFIIYPRPAQQMMFGAYAGADGPALSVTISGQGTVSMDVSLQFVLQNTQLVELYRDFGTNYRGRFSQSLASSVPLALQTAASVNVTDFYSNRGLISALAFQAARSTLLPYGAEVTSLQLLRVTLPTAVEASVVNTLVSNQQRVTAQAVQQQVQINADTTYIVGLVNQQIQVLVNSQVQNAAVILNSATSAAKAVEIDAAATAYNAFGQQLAFDNPALLRYIYLKNMRSLTANSTVMAQFSTLSALVQ
jgi:hypothetical protein